MISVYPSDLIPYNYNWITTRCRWFSDIHDMPENVIIPFYSTYYGNLIAFTSSEIKDQKQQSLIDYLIKCNDYCPPQFSIADVGTEWKGLIRKTGKPELVFAESDSEWFLLQCKYPDIVRVY